MDVAYLSRLIINLNVQLLYINKEMDIIEVIKETNMM